MTNDDDENEDESKRLGFPLSVAPNASSSCSSSSSEEKTVEKSKILPKPNLVQRKAKETENSSTLKPSVWNQHPPTSSYYSNYNQPSNGQYLKPSEPRELYLFTDLFLNKF